MFLQNVWTKWGNLLLLGSIIMCGLGIRLFLAWSGTVDLLTRILPDDSYYYFTIARQLAENGLSSFDGIHLTNGYHPLWMAIATAVYRLFPSFSSQDFPIHILLTSGALLDVATGILLIWWLGKWKMAFGARLIVALLYFLNPWIIAHGINGLESALANFFLLATTVCLSQYVTSQQTRSSKWLGLFSCLAALTILARIDYAIFIACLGLVLLFTSLRDWKVKDYVYVFLPGALLLGMWLIWSWLTFHALIPQSGFAFSLVNKTLFYYKDRAWWEPVVWSVYQWGQTLRIAAHVSGFSWFVWVVLLGFCAWMIQLKRKKQARSFLASLTVILILGFVIYTFLQGAVRWSGREWYFSFGPILALLILGQWLGSVPLTWRKSFMVIFLCLGLFWSQNPFPTAPFKNQWEMYQAAKALATLVPAEARVGAYNAGIYGYYSGRPIINLDGLVNISAFHALRERTMYTYLKQEQIDYILDYDIAVEYRYRPFFGRNDLTFLHPKQVLKEHSVYHDSKLRLFQVR
ncbi:hypothetical protein FJZ48_03205 [Candidatus Uhrbacteria bacterium]|nr:hypothetical protein [Candidatus Uhrbacteria bacterium]